MAWVAKDYIGEWIFNCKPDMWAGDCIEHNYWLCKKYGKLPENWQAFINDSIHEGMRVLKTNGTLIFKWNEQQIKVSDVLKAITDYKPIFGHRTTIKNQTIWMAFMK